VSLSCEKGNQVVEVKTYGMDLPKIRKDIKRLYPKIRQPNQESTVTLVRKCKDERKTGRKQFPAQKSSFRNEIEIKSNFSSYKFSFQKRRFQHGFQFSEMLCVANVNVLGTVAANRLAFKFHSNMMISNRKRNTMSESNGELSENEGNRKSPMFVSYRTLSELP